MASEPVKFRCFQCNRLLGVSRHKVGTVVACPKCGVELLVPDPDQAAADATGAGPEPDPAQVFRNLLGPRPEPDALDFGPEDIRALPGSPARPGPGPSPAREAPPPFLAAPPAEAPGPSADFSFLQAEPISLRSEAPTRRVKDSSSPGPPPPPAEPNPFQAIEPGPATPRPEPTSRAKAPDRPRPEPEPAPAPPPFPTIQTEPPALRDEPARRAPTTPAASPEPPGPPTAPSPWTAPANQPEPAATPTFPAVQVEPAPLRDPPPPILPPVRVEPPSIAPERTPTTRRSDVVLPRSAVILWSFFVLLALAASFGAGLLAGHFVWTNRPPTLPTAPAPAPKSSGAGD
jgi:DNA-directed RNA polymerase subunit RPC12/RpoP